MQFAYHSIGLGCATRQERTSHETMIGKEIVEKSAGRADGALGTEAIWARSGEKIYPNCEKRFRSRKHINLRGLPIEKAGRTRITIRRTQVLQTEKCSEDLERVPSRTIDRNLQPMCLYKTAPRAESILGGANAKILLAIRWGQGLPVTSNMCVEPPENDSRQ